MAHEQQTITNQTLSPELWRGQLYGSSLENCPIHARHMRSRCSSIPLQSAFMKKRSSEEKPPQLTDDKDSNGQGRQFAIFVSCWSFLCALPLIHICRARIADLWTDLEVKAALSTLGDQQ